MSQHIGDNKRSVLEKERREYVAAQHLRSQRKTTVIVGPLMLLICGITVAVNPSWQMWMVVGAMGLVQIALIRALICSADGRVRQASMLTMFSVLFFTSLTNLAIEGLLLPGLAAFMTTIFHASLFSRRSLIVGIPWTICTIIGASLLQYFDAYPFLVLEPSTLLMLQIVVTTLMLGQLFVYMLQAFSLNRFLISRLEGISTEQTGVIDAANELQPVITMATDQIQEISRDFAMQADRQAVATREVSATVVSVLRVSKETVQTAGETQAIAGTSRMALEGDRERLQNVERGFEAVVKMIEGARERVVNLSEQVERIEEILGANRSIGEHIQVLSVNAAIQAAKAGKFGRGFQVIASQLREMIQTTAENLAGSQDLLDQIRSESREASGSIQNGAEILGRYFDEFRATGRTIERTLASFVETSEKVSSIVSAAQQQQVGMTEMTRAIGLLETSAGELSSSASELNDAMGCIGESHDKLRKLLDSAE